jgi:hypothetical protein
MNSTLAPKETDPKDKAAAKPDAVATARADRTSARLARELRPSAAQDRTKSDVSAGKPNPAGNSTTVRGSSTLAGRSTSAGNSASAGGSPASAGANSTSVDDSWSAGGSSATAGSATSTGKSASADELAPSADATFRAAAVDNSQVPSRRRATGRWARRARMGLLLALCSTAAVAGWMHYGNRVKAYGVAAVRTMVAKWVPSGAPAASPPQESAEAAEQPGSAVLQSDAADQAAVPPAQSEPSVAASAAPLPPDTAQLLQSMSQQIAQLKAGMDEIRSGQDQIFRYMARNSEPRPAQARIPEQNLAPRIPVPPLRTAATAPVRKPRPPAQPGIDGVIRPPLPLR